MLLLPDLLRGVCVYIHICTRCIWYVCMVGIWGGLVGGYHVCVCVECGCVCLAGGRRRIWEGGRGGIGEDRRG